MEATPASTRTARPSASPTATPVAYDFLVVCPGIQLDWQKVPGLSETLGKDGVSSNYLAETAPKTWEFIRGMRRGTALFGMPSGPIKCAGAPQKIAYLAADYWRQQGVLADIRVVLILPIGTELSHETISKITDEMPRDRDGSFSPRLVPKGSRRLGGLDEIIISLYQP